ncbi:MAG TPA: hypothetical protein VFH68_17825 [Polyangia bacterium]|jgi:hypothetical protein|nr:hypothetical protein [Polyangia bacterium]
MSAERAAAETAATRPGAPEGGASAGATAASFAGSFADLDLHGLARRANAARRAALGDRASFVRARQLLATGVWRGPRDAAESYVEEDDLAALGGWEAARALGAGLLVGGRDPGLHRAAIADGARSLWRLRFRGGEERAARAARIDALGGEIASGLRLWGVLPTPEGEGEGLDTLHLMATCRLALPAVPHVLADVPALGPRLAQMALGFGADELFGPIVSERALRLGDNARNPAMTRKEAAILIRGAGLAACERLADLRLEEVTS